MLEAKLDNGESIRGLLSSTVSVMSRESWWPVLYQSSNDSPSAFSSWALRYSRMSGSGVGGCVCICIVRSCRGCVWGGGVIEMAIEADSYMTPR
jgi:hypothetical protein